MNAPLIKATKKEVKRPHPDQEKLFAAYNGAFMDEMSNGEFDDGEDDNSYLDTMHYDDEDDGYAEIDSEGFLDEVELFQGHLGSLGKQLLEKTKQGKISKEDFLAIKQSILD